MIQTLEYTTLTQTARPLELLAPARSADVGIAAIQHGADAVYIGGPGFGARAAAGNSVNDIARLCDYAHIFGAKVYVTLNTILYDEELAEAEDLVRQLDGVGVDALITQDLALLEMNIPPIALHASTQMDNTTAERAAELEAAGYSQIVLARELSIDDIREVRRATTVPLEAFVHGALCVSYSGRCYASEHCFGRSANRGRCAQFCRLAFDLIDGDGKTRVTGRHLLSLRDMRRLDSLADMAEAGVSSFKIEGRLKDAVYVKNVVAAYSQALDALVSAHPDRYVRASRGRVAYRFVPDVARAFNRGFTEYLLHGRTKDLWQFATPKSLGPVVGKVDRVKRRSFTVRGKSELHNGDGLAFFTPEGGVEGFRCNRVEGSEVFPLAMPSRLSMGTELYRNEDRLWEQQMAGDTADRSVPVTACLAETTDGFRLTFRADMGSRTVEGSSSIVLHHDDAQRPQSEAFRRVISKLGDTSFVLDDLEVEMTSERFIPASVLTAMRREAAESLRMAIITDHCARRDRRREGIRLNEKQADSHALDFTGRRFDYRSNVANRLARGWLMAHGATDVAPAYEILAPEQSEEAVLMTCRHCLRYAMDQCPKEKAKAARWQESVHSDNVRGAADTAWKLPWSLRLPDGREFPLRFDCKHCEMQVLRG